MRQHRIKLEKNKTYNNSLRFTKKNTLTPVYY